MGAKILVVDDDEDVRSFLARALDEIGGFSVSVAVTAKEALQSIEKAPFDLILVDFQLPDMDGLQLITEIVKSKPKILTVLLTGHGSTDTAVEAMKRGASDYLAKPVDLRELVACLSRVLEEKKRFLSIKGDSLPCSFGWDKIREMKENQTEFWAGDGLNRLRIVEVNERDRTIFMVTQEGKKTWPLRFRKLEEIHNKIHRGEIPLLAYEINRHIPTWGNYVSGLLQYLGCDKASK